MSLQDRARHQLFEVVDRVKPWIGKRQRAWIVARRFEARQLTASQRLLPDLLVIGAMRAGTSSLFKYLGRHPDVGPSLRKEIRFFSQFFHLGEAWYRAHFPLMVRRTLAEARGRPYLCFEDSPDYLHTPEAPARAADVIPDAKIVVLLRDPVERAWSHHQHMTRLGLEPLSFEDALEAEEERIGAARRRMAEDPTFDARDFRRYSYFSRGLYAVQIARWLDSFPRSRFLVLQSEEMYADTPRIYRDLLDFLGLPAWQPQVFKNFSYVAERPEKGPAMSAATRERLAERYAGPNRDLQALLGRDFGWPAPPMDAPPKSG
jgi:hypothetical protein